MEVNERRTVVGGLIGQPLCPPNRGERSTRMLPASLSLSRSRVYYGSVQMRHNKLWTVMKGAYFVTVIDGVFCAGRACDKQT